MLGTPWTSSGPPGIRHYLILLTYWSCDVQREKRGGGELPGGGGETGQGAPGQHPQERQSGKYQRIGGMVFTREGF